MFKQVKGHPVIFNTQKSTTTPPYDKDQQQQQHRKWEETRRFSRIVKNTFPARVVVFLCVWIFFFSK